LLVERQQLLLLMER
jgi:hypothetical protein